MKTHIVECLLLTHETLALIETHFREGVMSYMVDDLERIINYLNNAIQKQKMLEILNQESLMESLPIEESLEHHLDEASCELTAIHSLIQDGHSEIRGELQGVVIEKLEDIIANIDKINIEE